MAEVTHLQILDREAISPPARPWPEGLQVAPVHDHHINQALYARVGADWGWTDRQPWDEADWTTHADRVQTHVARLDGDVAGYYELLPGPDGVEVAVFGLTPEHVGHGLGGHLLVDALERGFALGARRVWLHTCTDDHPSALPGYLARGMEIYYTPTEISPDA